MWRDFQGLPFDIRFPPLHIAARIAGGRDPIMEPSSDPTKATGSEAGAGRPHPRASAWLWRPWYAKVWWAAIAAYWAGKVASLYSASLDQFYTTALAGFLNIAFFPPLALIVLGLGFARAWSDASDWEFVEPTHEEMFPKRSVGGMRDPCADPLDPRSGALHWRRVDGNP